MRREFIVPYTIYPNRLFLYRKQRGLTQREVGLLLGHEDGTVISDYERGVKAPSLIRVIELSYALNTPVEFLFEDTAREIQKDILHRRECLLKKGIIR